MTGLVYHADSGAVVRSAYPETSFTISLTNAVLLLRCPFMRETRGFGWRGVTFCSSNACQHVLRPSLEYALDVWTLVRLGGTYVTSIEADGDAGPLLDFLRHDG